MAKVKCRYYETAFGRRPVEEFIDALDIRTRTKFFALKELLEEYGYDLPGPHAKYIGDKIFELRFVGREGAVRVLYFFYHRDEAILTNGFLKKSNQTPKGEKRLAIQRREQYLSGNR